MQQFNLHPIDIYHLSEGHLTELRERDAHIAQRDAEVLQAQRMVEDLPSVVFCREVNENFEMVENAQKLVNQVVVDKDLEQKAADLVTSMDALQAWVKIPTSDFD